jgi:hypothetical protein
MQREETRESHTADWMGMHELCWIKYSMTACGWSPYQCKSFFSSLRPVSQYCKNEANIYDFTILSMLFCSTLVGSRSCATWLWGSCVHTMWFTMSPTEYPWISSKLGSLVCTLPSTLHSLTVECKWDRWKLTVMFTSVDSSWKVFSILADPVLTVTFIEYHWTSLACVDRTPLQWAACVPWLASGISTDQPWESMDLFDTRGMASWLWEWTLVTSFLLKEGKEQHFENKTKGFSSRNFAFLSLQRIFICEDFEFLLTDWMHYNWTFSKKDSWI